MSFGDSHVYEAAQRAALLVNQLIDRSPRRLLNEAQMRSAAGNVSANIAEGCGRRTGAERNFKFEVARGEADKALDRLKSNFATGRIAARDYWPVHNLLRAVVKMLDSLING